MNPGKERVMKDEKKLLERARNELERRGYFVSECVGSLKKVFDISADSIYPQSTDAGSYIKIQVDEIDPAALLAIEDFRSFERKKEVWLLRFLKDKVNDPGRFLEYRFYEKELIAQPEGFPLEDMLKKK